MTLGERIRQRRKELGLSQADLAGLLSYGDRSTIAKIESGKNDLTQSKIAAFAKVLNTTPSFLMGWTEDPTDYDDPDLIASIPLSYMEACDGDAERAYHMMKAAQADAANDRRLPPPEIAKSTLTFPVITSVAAHYDSISYDESLEGDTVEIPEIYLKGRNREDFCAMRVRGDSMFPAFQDGDIVLVLKQSAMNHSGEIGVISYGNDEMTIKRINYAENEDWLEMVPLNPSYPPKKIEGVDLESCHIIGIPRVLIREF